ncbi:MAG: hypothetical protein PWP65_601 [Clostridia bacterium]|nr:hypothetical protein [Clostridia bacterium]
MRKTTRLAMVAFLAVILAGLYLSGHVSGREIGRPPQPQDSPPKTGVIENIPARLQKALFSAGAKTASVHLEGWALLAPAFMNSEDLAAAARRTAALLNLEGDPEFKVQQEKNFIAYNWESEIEPGVVLYFSVQSLKSAGPRGETYLLLNIDGRPGATNDGAAILSSWEERFRGAFAFWKKAPHMTFNVTGVLPGKLSPAAGEEVAERILRDLGARRIEGMLGEDLLSISAYAPGIPGGVVAAGKKINVNIALRYHSTDGLTYIHLGSPLLSGEY